MAGTLRRRAASAPAPRSVREEIQQGRPFRSRRQEGTIALLRTASVVGRAIARELEPWNLSLAQYNALRIIRGAGAGGVPTLAVRHRMIEEGTTITRILDKLDAAGLIRRSRTQPDRRQVMCEATAQGRRLLDKIDPVIDAADEAATAALTAAQLDQLITALDVVRAANAARAVPRTMYSG